MRIPTQVECNQIPQGKEEILTPEVAREFSNLRDIAGEIPPIHSMRIHILIGRYAPELLKVRAFQNGSKDQHVMGRSLLSGYHGKRCL